MDSVESVRAWRQEFQNIAQRKAEPKPVSSLPRPAYAKPAALPAPSARPASRSNDYESLEDLEALDVARTRLMIADANIAEMKEAEMDGKLRKKIEVDSKAFEVARALRDGLTNCARRIAAEVSGLSSADACEAVIDREHRLMMDNMWAQLTNELNVCEPEVAL